MPTLLAIGTGKGLFLATSDDRRRWQVSGPHFRRLGGLDAPVPDGAEVQVLPSVAGG